MKKSKKILIISLVFMLLFTLLQLNVNLENAYASTNITINGSGAGRTFQGIGALSAGASSKLLYDYPEPQRSQVLDYLFKPNYGANLQILKVEIGGDTNSTDGSEPSHQHSTTDNPNYNRGYEWWLMEQAKLRNPSIKISALEWGAPSYLGGVCTQANADYVTNWIKGAKFVHNIDVDYVGIWNETSCGSAGSSYIKALRNTLNSNSLTNVKIIADDLFNFDNMITFMNSDPALAAAIDTVGEHYQSTLSSSSAQASGKILQSAEDGPWSSSFNATGNGGPLYKLLNRNYINGKMTSTIIWALVSSYYNFLSLPGAGLMTASEPWSGNYNTDSNLWVMAHTAQFVKIGWQYIDSASALLPSSAGSYVTLKSNTDNNYSAIIETNGATVNQTLNFTVVGGLSTGTVHVWHTNSTTSFEQLLDITPTNGTFSITVEPNALYTLTTTTGQSKGTISGSIPASAPFPATYSDNFDSYSVGETNPKYISPQNGAYEVQSCISGRSGKCLAQVVNSQPTRWPSASGEPVAILGNKNWTNYSVSVDANLQESGFAELTGRMSYNQDGTNNGYQLNINSSGTWSLAKNNGSTQLATGSASIGTNTWHTLKLDFKGTTITAFIDGIQVSSVVDTTYYSGAVNFGSGWNKAQFDNLTIISISQVNGSFVTNVTPGTLRNNYGDYVGMKISVGSNPIVVTQLGRYFAAGNSGTHAVKIVNARNNTDLASVPVNMGSGSVDAVGFKYAPLASPVTLAANTSYYIVSLETSGGDSWYDLNTTVNTTNAAVVNNAIYHSGSSWITVANANNTYGPVNFKGIVSGGTYKIIGQQSGKTLDVYGAGTANGSNVDIWTDENAPQEKWIITSLGDGTYKIINVNSNKALDVNSALTANGSNVDTWDYVSGTPNEKWKIIETTDGSYKLIDFNSNKALDVYGAVTADGSNVDIWDDVSGATNEEWNLIMQ
jgi:hypothetical protein